MIFNSIRRSLSFARRAVQDYDMIEDGDVIAVGVSGGKDSLALLATLIDLKRFYPKSFEVCAITLDMGFADRLYTPLEDFYNELGIRYSIVRTEIAKIIFEVRQETNPCALCAKMRRGMLHDEAKRMGANKLALGHNFDDMLETFMMNLFNEGRIGTFSPVTYLDRKDITVIRPLALMPEKDVCYFVRQNSFPIIKSPCPEDKHTDREKYKNMLYSMDKERIGTMHRLFEAIKSSDVDGWGCDDRSVNAFEISISSNDIVKTADFYTEKLGFAKSAENGIIMLSRGKCRLLLTEDGYDTKYIRITTKRLDTLYSEFSKKGLDPTEPMIEKDKSRAFSVTDIDGRTLVFTVK